jgi:hypothetical protein
MPRQEIMTAPGNPQMSSSLSVWIKVEKTVHMPWQWRLMVPHNCLAVLHQQTPVTVSVAGGCAKKVASSF